MERLAKTNGTDVDSTHQFLTILFGPGFLSSLGLKRSFLECSLLFEARPQSLDSFSGRLNGQRVHGLRLLLQLLLLLLLLRLVLIGWQLLLLLLQVFFLNQVL